MLTPKREAYVQNLIKGMSQREAYKAAFDAHTATDKTIDNKASKLFAVDEVRARYEALQSEVIKASQAAAVASAVEILEELTNIGMGRKRYPTVDMFGKEYMSPVTMTNRVKALELLGKKYGLFTDKVDVNASGSMVVILGEDKLED